METEWKQYNVRFTRNLDKERKRYIGNRSVQRKKVVQQKRNENTTMETDWRQYNVPDTRNLDKEWKQYNGSTGTEARQFLRSCHQRLTLIFLPEEIQRLEGSYGINIDAGVFTCLQVRMRHIDLSLLFYTTTSSATQSILLLWMLVRSYCNYRVAFSPSNDSGFVFKTKIDMFGMFRSLTHSC